MKKILIASPVRGGVSPAYIRALISLHFSKCNAIMGGPTAPYNFMWAATSGTSVNLARDELASVALDPKANFDGIVWWDIDLNVMDPGVMMSMFLRLLSHIDRVEVVAGQYVGHNFLSNFHGAVTENNPVPDEHGLLEMAQIPLGFSYTSTKALKQISDFHPHRRYAIKETGDRKGKPDMFEYFPIGVCGPCSAYGKIERIRDLCKNCEPDTDFEEQVNAIINDTRYETNHLLGEDFYFCKLAREAGVKLYVDNNLIIPHETNVRLPVNNQDLLKALSEDWRLNNDAKPEQVKELVAKLTPLLSPDIPT